MTTNKKNRVVQDDEIAKINERKQKIC